MKLEVKSIIRNKLGSPGLKDADSLIGKAYILGWIATFRALEFRAYFAASELKELTNCQKSLHPN